VKDQVKVATTTIDGLRRRGVIFLVVMSVIAATCLAIGMQDRKGNCACGTVSIGESEVSKCICAKCECGTQ